MKLMWGAAIVLLGFLNSSTSAFTTVETFSYRNLTITDSDANKLIDREEITLTKTGGAISEENFAGLLVHGGFIATLVEKGLAVCDRRLVEFNWIDAPLKDGVIKDVRVQIGIVNIADIADFQLGFVNTGACRLGRFGGVNRTNSGDATGGVNVALVSNDLGGDIFGAAVALFHTRIAGSVNGLVTSLFYADVAGSVNGVLGAGFYNRVGGNQNGVTAGVYNQTEGSRSGVVLGIARNGDGFLDSVDFMGIITFVLFGGWLRFRPHRKKDEGEKKGGDKPAPTEEEAPAPDSPQESPAGQVPPAINLSRGDQEELHSLDNGKSQDVLGDLLAAATAQVFPFEMPVAQKNMIPASLYTDVVIQKIPEREIADDQGVRSDIPVSNGTISFPESQNPIASLEMGGFPVEILPEESTTIENMIASVHENG